MPAAQIELDDGHKALHRIIDLWHGKQCIGVCHETVI
jgi:hypothetical protein